MARQSFIAKLLKQENTNIEFKSRFEIKPILQTICAFLNSDGGWVLIGYSGTKTIGIVNRIDERIEELEDAVFSEISPQPLVYISEESYEDKKLILINVLRGSRQPYTFDNVYYIRDRASTQKASVDEISLLLRKSTSDISLWEKINVTDANIDDLDQEEIWVTMVKANEKGRDKGLPNDAQSFLSYFDLIDYSFVSNAAMLLFGKEPLRFIPQCRINIAVMPFGKSGNTYTDEFIIEHNLFSSLSIVLDYFRRNLPIISEFDQETGNRNTLPKYPVNVLREAIVNAIVHRDYSDFSGDITINIYNEYIEIINSGEIPPNIVNNKSQILPHHSIFRNPTIGHIFYLRGKMEKRGRGLGLIKDELIEKGYRSPEWLCENGYTTLKLYSISEDLNDRMIKFLNNLKKGEPFTNQNYFESFSDEISERTARGDILALVRGKYLKVEGSGPSTKYRRTNKDLPDNAR